MIGSEMSHKACFQLFELCPYNKRKVASVSGLFPEDFEFRAVVWEEQAAPQIVAGSSPGHWRSAQRQRREIFHLLPSLVKTHLLWLSHR